jgi:PAS domain S-box-containing protein
MHSDKRLRKDEMESLANIATEDVINSLSDGIYICDLDRRITYWSKAASRITGWREEDVVGRQCLDNVLCHIDKDGRQLCGEEYCPLHRAMVTGKLSQVSQLIYAQGAQGQRIPMQVTVAPVFNNSGKVIGGVETFRDASAIVNDLERAKAIQQLAMEEDIPEDVPVAFRTHYMPLEIVGGDYYAIKHLSDGQYGLMLADVMGHGISSALYTVHLSSLFNQYYPLLRNPSAFAGKVNQELAAVVKANISFATAVCGLVDLNERTFRFTSAGGPEVVLMQAEGTYKCLKGTGLPLALMADAEYKESSAEICQGDCLLLFSDGAVEVMNADGEILGTEGLIEILRKRGYPQKQIQIEALHEDLLKYSNSIRLEDDLTIIEVHF